MTEPSLTCPTPLAYQHIVMAHGGGGRMMQQLLDTVIRPALSNPLLDQQHDSAVLQPASSKLAFTSDSYVIKPLFFPGGDIGKLAVCGTLNDLAMSGAKPLYLSCSLIIEEGLAIADLQRILQSMRATADAAGVQIVTGDTKVVDKGKGDGLYINTAGIGIIEHPLSIHPQAIQTGDAIIINSDLARHGISIMLQREGLAFDHDLHSDCADLSAIVTDLLQQGIAIHCLRDLTRGGLASVLLELATLSQQQFSLNQSQLVIQPAVQNACDILGFDPLYVANEGCFALFIPQPQAALALKIIQKHPAGEQARQIGQVVSSSTKGGVCLQTTLGISRALTLMSGEQLPRIC